MSDKASKKTERVAKVLGRRLSSMLLRAGDTKRTSSSPRRQTEPQSQRSSLTVINSHHHQQQQQQWPASECSSPDSGKRLSRRGSFKQRFWSASSSNVDGDGSGPGPGSGFAKPSASGPGCGPVIDDARKVVGRRPSAARVQADEANARIMQRFSTCAAAPSLPSREDDEHTLCSFNDNTIRRVPSGELDGVVSSLHRDQALSMLNEARRRPSDPSPMSSPRVVHDNADDSSDDDEYGVFQDHGESRRHARESLLAAETDRSANRQSMASLNLLTAPSRNSMASSRSSMQFSSAPHRNSTLSSRTSGGQTNRTSVYSNRSSVLSHQSSASSSSDVSDRGSFCDPVLHRGSTYMDPDALPTPESLAALDKLRSLTAPSAADLAKGSSQKRKHSGTAQAPRFETVMEV